MQVHHHTIQANTTNRPVILNIILHTSSSLEKKPLTCGLESRTGGDTEYRWLTFLATATNTTSIFIGDKTQFPTIWVQQEGPSEFTHSQFFIHPAVYTAVGDYASTVIILCTCLTSHATHGFCRSHPPP